jgi:hypothetical protein
MKSRLREERPDDRGPDPRSHDRIGCVPLADRPQARGRPHWQRPLDAWRQRDAGHICAGCLTGKSAVPVREHFEKLEGVRPGKHLVDLHASRPVAHVLYPNHRLVTGNQ